MKHHHEKQMTDKSTVYDGSTEEPHEHPNFPKPPKDKWFNVIVIPMCIWLAIGWISCQYNIGQGDLKPHTWELMNTGTAVLLMYWSAKMFEFITNKSYKNSLTQKLAGLGMVMCFSVFIVSGLYLFKISVEFIVNFFN